MRFTALRCNRHHKKPIGHRRRPSSIYLQPTDRPSAINMEGKQSCCLIPIHTFVTDLILSSHSICQPGTRTHSSCPYDCVERGKMYFLRQCQLDPPICQNEIPKSLAPLLFCANHLFCEAHMMLRLSQLLIKAIYLKEVTETIATIDRNIFKDVRTEGGAEIEQQNAQLKHVRVTNCIEILFNSKYVFQFKQLCFVVFNVQYPLFLNGNPRNTTN